MSKKNFLVGIVLIAGLIVFCLPDYVSAISVSISAQVGSDDTDSGGGSGGGGGGGSTFERDQVVFRGTAYPGSFVSLTKDSELIARVPSGMDAKFEIGISGLSRGTYTFGVWGEDSAGLRSIMHTFTVTISRGATTLISGIFIAPTISIDKIQVKRGDILSILGQTAPKATVSILINSEKELVKSVSADDRGLWVYKFDTLEVEYGDHTTKARAEKEQDFTAFSQSLGFKVGETNVVAPKRTVEKRGDMNGDGRVNLVDFSIVAYWYKREITSAGVLLKVDVNSDGKVDIVDFSILAYNWTG